MLLRGSDDIGLGDWTERESLGTVEQNANGGPEVGTLHPPLADPRPDVTASVGESWSLPFSFAGSALFGGASGNLWIADFDHEIEVSLERGQPAVPLACCPARASGGQLADDGKNRFVHVPESLGLARGRRIVLRRGRVFGGGGPTLPNHRRSDFPLVDELRTPSLTWTPPGRDDPRLLGETQEERNHLVPLRGRMELPKGVLNLLVSVCRRIHDLEHAGVGRADDLLKAGRVIVSRHPQLTERVGRHAVFGDETQKPERAQRSIRVGVSQPGAFEVVLVEAWGKPLVPDTPDHAKHMLDRSVGCWAVGLYRHRASIANSLA